MSKDSSSKHKSLNELVAHLIEVRDRAVLDIPEDRVDIRPYATATPVSIFYEDAWIKVSLTKLDGSYKMEWTHFTKSDIRRETEFLTEVHSEYAAYLWLREHIEDYWTAGTFHPLSDDGKTPVEITALFAGLEKRYNIN